MHTHEHKPTDKTHTHTPYARIHFYFTRRFPSVSTKDLQGRTDIIFTRVIEGTDTIIL